MPIHTHVEDRIATITIDQPPVNALATDTMREITSVFREMDANQNVSVIVLRAEGDKVFSAGADINDSERRYAKRESGPQDTAVDILDPGRAIRDCFMTVFECSVPTISSVQGIALGSGLSLIACTDMIIASERARFGLPEITVGVLGGGRFLQRLLGIPKMRSMYFTGEQVDAAEMYRLGAVEQVVQHDQLEEATLQMARKIAMKSPLGLRLGKLALNRAEALSVPDGYRTEQDYTAKVSAFEDAMEARNAWREKREPVWNWQ